MECRPGCGACCIAPSISSLDKPAGEPCRHLTPDLRCAIFAATERPACCSGLNPAADICGSSRNEALMLLHRMELATAPGENVAPIV